MVVAGSVGDEFAAGDAFVVESFCGKFGAPVASKVAWGDGVLGVAKGVGGVFKGGVVGEFWGENGGFGAEFIGAGGAVG